MNKSGLERRNKLRGRAFLTTATHEQIGQIVLALAAGPILDNEANVLDALDLPQETRDLLVQAVSVISSADLDALSHQEAMLARVDNWIPACDGKETPLRDRSGRLVLYCFNPAQRRHAYIDLASDIEIPADEAERMFSSYRIGEEG